MLRNRLYYGIKPFVPWSARMTVRRWFARRKRERVQAVWPVLPGSEQPPAGWPGWPEAKQFAFVLTHDVEGPDGLAKCRQLAELEMSLGFRSCFNFVPEGDYRVPSELRDWLLANGFEVGVHDLYHDGTLHRSRRDFLAQARRINHHLKDWNAVGFRAGFMRHNLDWQHALDVQYDCSTFDTDPFEPQPDGVGTIFPFWVPNPAFTPNLNLNPNLNPNPAPADQNSEIRNQKSNPPSEFPLSTSEKSIVGGPSSVVRGPWSVVPPLRPGYVELPYTLPQDSTLFLLFREKTPAIWLRKLDWVAQHGGMALVNVHPDYLQFPGQPPAARTFPVEFYTQLLKHVRERHVGQYWHPLPREVGERVIRHRDAVHPVEKLPRLRSDRDSEPGRPIWIDLENTPHIPFFRPIIRELEQRGHTIMLTARDAYQTCEMAERYGLRFTRIGHHYGKHKLLKMWGLLARGLQLLPFALRHRPRLALNHGSRTQTLISNLLGIPTVTIMDYEHTAELFFLRPMWEINPGVVPKGSIPCRPSGGILKYSGIKEDVYIHEFKPDPSILPRLGLDPGQLVVTVRPPATEAHYHNPEAEQLFEGFMNRVCATPGIQAVLLPRNKRQESQIRAGWPHWFDAGKTCIPSGVVEGLNLLWHSDLVVSGGAP